MDTSCNPLQPALFLIAIFGQVSKDGVVSDSNVYARRTRWPVSVETHKVFMPRRPRRVLSD